MTRPAPPSGEPPPAAYDLPGGVTVDLAPLARATCGRYFEAYPDDVERYGDAGSAWCDHDTRYLLTWALEDANAALVDCVEQVAWLARVLEAREFPVERLRRHVELTADVLDGAGLGSVGARAAARLREAAASTGGRDG